KPSGFMSCFVWTTARATGRSGCDEAQRIYGVARNWNRHLWDNRKMTLDKQDRGIMLLALGMAIEQTRKAIAACSHPQFGGERFSEVVKRERTLEQLVELRQRLKEEPAAETRYVVRL